MILNSIVVHQLALLICFRSYIMLDREVIAFIDRIILSSVWRWISAFNIPVNMMILRLQVESGLFAKNEHFR